MLRRGYNIDVGVVEHDFKKDGNRRKVQLEVDFVINKGHQRYYIQSALNVDSTEKREQETACSNNGIRLSFQPFAKK